jgi:hypothetical protein
MVVIRIVNWFKCKVKLRELSHAYREMEQKYIHEKNLKQSYYEENVKLKGIIQTLQKAMHTNKISAVTTILTYYETNVKHPMSHPIRIELMEKTLNALTTLIACDDPSIDKRADNIFFWRRMEDVLGKYGAYPHW